MLNIKLDQIESELGAFLVLRAFKSKLKSAGVLVSLKGDRIVSSSELHNLYQAFDVDTQNHIGVTSVRLEPFTAEIERNQGNVRGIHSLK